MTLLQSREQKQAEILYRKNLELGKYQDSEPTQEEILQELKNRNQNTLKDLNLLKKLGINFSPFLEIGAERGQRSLLLAEKFKAKGVMLDLSLESLKQSAPLSRTLKLSRIPPAVCSDAYHLPFHSESFAFVFIYQTLHHFPDPLPILKEVKRVLKPEGVFFFNEEPIRQNYNLRLWRRPTKLRWWEKPLKYFGLLHFISEIGKTETDAGILETSFDLNTWEEALNIFKNVEAEITVFPFGPAKTLFKPISNNSNQFQPTNWLIPPPQIQLLLNLLGGSIRAICYK